MSTTLDAGRPRAKASDFDVLPEWHGHEDDVFGVPEKLAKPKNGLRVLLEWGAVIAGALLAALLIKTFLFQAFYIPSESMVPTLNVGDRVLVNKVAYDFGDIARSDIIVFRKPDNAPASEVNEFIKRVVGLGGDTIESIDGHVVINDVPLEETYLPEGVITSGIRRQTIPEGSLFVMGDNRRNSQDSRVFGPVNVGLVVGKAFVRVWPIPAIGGL